VIPVALFGIDVEMCEEFFERFQELLGPEEEGYEAMLYRIEGQLDMEHLAIIDEWAGYTPLSVHDDVAQEILSILEVSSYPDVSILESLLTIEGMDINRISHWLHFTTHVYPIWNEETCAGLRRLRLNAPFEDHMAAYGKYVEMIEGIKEHAPMEALPESPLPRQRLLENALAEWSRRA
tara:strand:- start:209 stop:745 length:537 start_codon:yes stop_codon:yes gene_type:complete